ncbi:homoserine kinase [uncultured Clostridium sp.]|uniref:homoserine kinase n=1 Tax=uncultured Clostridium sp. TaxID=59620 RepID=UPI0025FA682D|nr:homoserine kinase [uncultured Clostridium sp.]MDU4884238.1 homoserine kinase [Clostridium celatum]MDU7078259.1 homoserine kinase [Clostridium celatum]
MIKVRVPATSANLGPGFDSLGIALNIYNEYEFELKEDKGLFFEGVEEEFQNKDNIIFMAIKKVFDKYDFKFNGIKIKIIKQDIPISRGLGSSSSCIVAGIIGAFALMGREINRDEILSLAVDIEGHPDNVCPAIFGGLISTIMVDNKKTLYNCVEVKDGIKFIALIPRFKLSTEKARAILPKEILFRDCIYNIGRAALLISCFSNGNYALLKEATKDRIHERFRSKLIDNFDEVYNKSLELGAISCFLSGAGPTLMAIVDTKDISFVSDFMNFMKEQNINWDIKELKIDKHGAKILKGE